MRFQSVLATTALCLLSSWGAWAQGAIEINQAVVDEAGGFPFVIDAPGVYVLTGNLEKASGTANLIEISADNVTLDLQNHFLLGPGSCTINPLTCTGHLLGSGVRSTGDFVTIRNGHTNGLARGIDAAGDSTLLENLIVRASVFDGVRATGNLSRVKNVESFSNNGTGIVVGNFGEVSECTGSTNGAHGIATSLDTPIADSNAYLNDGNGLSMTNGAFSNNDVIAKEGSDPVLGGFDAGDNRCSVKAGSTLVDVPGC